MSKNKKSGGRRVSRRGDATILFEDDDLLIINKPAGLLSVPIKGSRAVNLRDSLNEYLLPKRQKAIIVHRIDRYTSGLMVFAKNRTAHAKLVKQFLAHTPTRIYLTMVRGKLLPEKGELVHFLKLTKYGFRQAVVEDEGEGGTRAVTRYKVREYLRGTTLLQVQLVTGLKNQIRVQLWAAGHPVVGDRHYEKRELKEEQIDHQALHAWKLGFIHPRTDKYVEFEAPLPTEFNRLIAKYRNVIAE